ncbi:methyl-accepting chemotaxis protein [Terrilactibacillus laevilacticus]|uniref:Methyl-accepting chemotaxis protein n=1 Tax=Terrilactibacillus laevilacticus TaxID=1380157 RepID=A0ABW5PSV7_9BACI|nr:methyl-accepting chemotaxis protein [Terrilactibacillus laevilacticus]
MDWSIKKKIKSMLFMGIIGIILLALFTCLTFVNSKWTNGKVNAIHQNANLAESIHTKIEKARTLEQMYLAKPKKEYVVQLNNLLKEIKQDTKSFSNQSDVVKKSTKDINNQVKVYQESLNQVVSITELIGYTENEGLHKRFLETEKKLDSMINNTNNHELVKKYLQLKLQEKTYFDNPTSKGFNEISNEINDFNLYASSVVSDNNQNEFSSTLLKYKSINDSINSSYNLSDSLREQFASASSHIEKSVDKVVNSLNQQNQDIDHHQTTIGLTFFIIALLLSIAIAVVLYWFGRRLSTSISDSLHELTKGATKIGEGHLNYRVPITTQDELGQFAESFNKMTAYMEKTIQKVFHSTKTLTQSSENLAAASEENVAQVTEVNEAIQQVAAGAQNQADHLDQSMNLLSNVTQAIDESKVFSQQVLQKTKETEKTSQEGLITVSHLETSANEYLKVISSLIHEIKDVATQSENIKQILKTIKSISDNTNLLALNAAIESARAGEAGKGFAVVSKEIRNLAERSKKETNQINEDISNIIGRLSHLTTMAETLNQFSEKQRDNVAMTKVSFDHITDKISSINNMMDNINGKVTHVKDANQNLVIKLEEISAISEETAASTEEVSAASENQKFAIGTVTQAATDLQAIAIDLENEVLKFTFDTQDSEMDFDSNTHVASINESAQTPTDNRPKKEIEQSSQQVN